VRAFREAFRAVRTEGCPDLRELLEVAQRWRNWLGAHEDGDVRTFQEAFHAIRAEFFKLCPSHWPNPGALPPDDRFAVVWPTEPLFTKDGAAILRFPAAPHVAQVSFMIATDADGTKSDRFEVLQFDAGARVEIVARVCFPADGKYTVIPVGAEAGVHVLRQLSEAVYGPHRWRVEVRGAPPATRPLLRLVAGREPGPLWLVEAIEVQPGGACIRLPNKLYNFSCRFRGKQVLIIGGQPPGEPEVILFPKTVLEPSASDWSLADCELEFPDDGLWRVYFMVDGLPLAVQEVLVGEDTGLELTDTERRALAAPLPPV
jgi:hypothetical protein